MNTQQVWLGIASVLVLGVSVAAFGKFTGKYDSMVSGRSSQSMTSDMSMTCNPATCGSSVCDGNSCDGPTCSGTTCKSMSPSMSDNAMAPKMNSETMVGQKM